MMRKILPFGGAALLCLVLCTLRAQSVDSVTGEVFGFPSRLLGKLQQKAADVNNQLTQQTQSYLQKMARREARMQQKLFGVDSNAAKSLFAGSAEHYTAVQQKMRTDSGGQGRPYSGVYPAYLDSMQGSMGFLNQNPQLLNNTGTAQLAQLRGATSQFQTLQAKMGVAGEAQAYMQERKQMITDYIVQHANLQGVLSSSVAGMKKDIYYYSQTLRQYQEIWTSPDKLEQQTLALLNRVPAFQSFMKANSMLGGLFNVPQNYGTPQGAFGLQTKDQVAAIVNQQTGLNNTAGSEGTTGAGTPAADALQGNLQSAQSQLDTYKSKLSQLGAGNGNLDMPNFNPNDQKTKTFWKRIVYGANFQTSRNNYYFPMVTDFGFSLGYKLGHNNVIGVGASYKLGWGNGIQHIAFTNEGVGLRSFLQIKIRGTFSATGGFEYNYTTPSTTYQQLRFIQNWTKSGLIGVTKTVSMQNRFFKSTSLGLLWDFLSYQQIPQTQPFIFRIGYNF